jgi:DNA repair exonuclease SbcCD ATPase subunit
VALFGKKKVEPGQDQPVGDMMPPNNNVGSENLSSTILNLQQQGLSNNQIINQLQSQGYNSQQIFDAMNSVDPSNVPAGPMQSPTPSASPDMQPPGMTMPGSGFAQAPTPQETQPNSSGFEESREKIEELAEAIIDEKWEELVKNINKIIEWKDKMEGDFAKIQQEIQDLKETFNQLHSSIIGKINEYDKNIVNVGTQVKAMEKVFEKVLPTFTENIGELKRIVKSTKK